MLNVDHCAGPVGLGIQLPVESQAGVCVSGVGAVSRYFTQPNIICDGPEHCSVQT